MTTFKNARTGYFVGPWVEGTTTAETITLELAAFISDVTNDSSETVNQTAYYDGDGSLEDEVDGLKFTNGFTGLYDETNVAQKFIADLEFVDGTGRKIGYKEVRNDGTTYWGRATVSAIKTTGGAASDFAPFTCTISFDKVPTKIDPVPTP